MTNNESAHSADQALEHYAMVTGSDEDWTSLIGDLLGDLMHFCAHKGLNFDEHLSTARVHFNTETGSSA
ncbi:MAG: hypothetical protein V3R83_10990 [Gammaproteobacteria bacterium]